MNERIKELLTQAGVRSEIMLDDSSRDVECLVTVYDGSTPSIHNWEKFAELIVRECCDWIDGSPTSESGCQLLLTKQFIIANLKGHFGL